MSYVDAPSRWSGLISNALDHFPRLTLLAAIVLAWVTTLAWPPMPADFQPRVDRAETSNPNYPVRMMLPEPEPIAGDELVELAKEHDALASLNLDLSRKGGGEFDSAFSDFLAPKADLNTPPASELRPGEFLELDYDLTTLEPVPESLGASSSGSSLTVKKPLYVDGVSSGSATIRIEEGAQILIATSAVARALGERTQRLPSRISGALAKGNGFIPFYELRGAGIAVEYDPVTDRISLSMPS